MQEEIENRTVTLIISAVKLTARELKAGMDKYLSEKKSKAMEKARAAPEKPSGKQTVKQLIGQNQGVRQNDRNLLRDLHRAHPHGDHGQPGMGADGPELP